MINIVRHSLVAFLSTFVFFAVCAVAGDVLIAATIAIAIVIAQLVLGWTAHGKLGGMTWASLALVLMLTGTTLAGDDAATAAAVMSAAHQNITPVNAACGARPLAI